MTGPDGNLWFTATSADKIGMINLKNNNTVTEFDIPTANSGPTGIVTGPDGNSVVHRRRLPTRSG